MEDKWINKIRVQMKDYQMSEPDGLWDDIEKVLDEQQPVPVSGKKSVSSVVVFWRRVAASIVVALAVALALLNLPHNVIINDAESPLADAHKENVPTASESASESRSPLRQTARSAIAAIRKSDYDSAKQGAVAQCDKLNIAQADNQTSVAETDDADENLPTKQAAEERPQQQPQTKGKTTKPSDGNVSLNLPAKSHKSSGLSVDLYASNVASSTNFTDVSVEGNNYSSDAMFGGYPVYGASGDEKEQKPKFNMKHRLPVRYGISLKYDLSDRLSLNTGVVYSRHSSSAYRDVDYKIKVAEQRLHYLGIPLGVSYRLWKSGDFSIYGSAGAMAEKCLHGELVDDFNGESTKIKEEKLQFSVNGAVGAQYDFSRVFGLYVEPGVVYYIDNGSDVDNIYKDKPVNFNLEVGLRITFK